MLNFLSFSFVISNIQNNNTSYGKCYQSNPKISLQLERKTKINCEFSKEPSGPQ